MLYIMLKKNLHLEDTRHRKLKKGNIAKIRKPWEKEETNNFT